MHATKIDEKQAMNLKNSKEGYAEEFGGRKVKGKCSYNCIKMSKGNRSTQYKNKKNLSCIDDSSILLQFKNENYFSLFAQQ